MLAIALSPLFVMEAASLTELSQNYRSALPAAGVDADVQIDIDSPPAEVNLSERLELRRSDLDNEANMRAVAEYRSNTQSRTTATLPNIPNTGTERALEVASENSVLLEARGVSTEADLRAFGLAAIESDKNLNSMSFDNEEVVVGYRGQGRFIGLLPVFLNVDVRVDQDGKVEFDYPWYGFLIAKDDADIEDEIRAEIEALIAARAEGGSTNTDRAQLAAAIVEILRSHYEASVAIATEEVEE